MPKTAIKIGAKDHGRPMSLADFDHAEVQEGYLYELGRGVIVVSDVPGLRHLVQLDALRRQFYSYDATHPGKINIMGGGSDCKMLLWEEQSERHPDLSIYKTRPPTGDEDLWSAWVPDMVIEVVSPSSVHRDYVEKREEYLAFGVREYWTVDADKEEVLVLRRSRGRWAERVLRPGDSYRTRLLPGFEFDCTPVFEAARAAGS